jgi:hypothetical protein
MASHRGSASENHKGKQGNMRVLTTLTCHERRIWTTAAPMPREAPTTTATRRNAMRCPDFEFAGARRLCTAHSSSRPPLRRVAPKHASGLQVSNNKSFLDHHVQVVLYEQRALYRPQMFGMVHFY